MKKRILSLALLLICTFMLFGCTQDGSVSDKPVISDNTFKIGVLLSETEVATQYIESGIAFANSLANRVTIDDIIEVSYLTEYYSDSNDVTTSADNLINNGASVIIYSGEDYNSFINLTEYISDKPYPLISLCPFECESSNVFSLSLSKEYMSSCVATYILEKGHSSSAVVFEDDNQFYSDFAQVYKNTFESYTGYEPTMYFKNGESSNYSPSVLAADNYQSLFLVCSEKEREPIVTELRASGFGGEIIFDEILINSSVNSNTYNNCSLVSKTYADGSNNIATVFYSMYTEQYAVKAEDIEPAVAYGYDSYMIAFEALKSFGTSIGNSIFSNKTTTEVNETSDADTILSGEYIEAISQLNYFGVTDTITFEGNRFVPTYVYVNNIVDAEIIFGNKYSFTSNNL